MSMDKYPCSVYSINYIDDIRQHIDIDNRKIQAAYKTRDKMLKINLIRLIIFY